MKRWLAIFFCIVLFCATTSFTADPPDPYSVKSSTVKTVPIKPAPQKTPPLRETRMRATGRVTEISPAMMKIDRNVKDTVETMDFYLSKPLDKIKVGDEVGVSYITKENKNIAKRVSKVTKKKITPTLPPPGGPKPAVSVPVPSGTPGR